MTTRVVRRVCFQGTARDVAAVLGPHVGAANLLGYPETVTYIHPTLPTLYSPYLLLLAAAV